jgi:hypothetical protein
LKDAIVFQRPVVDPDGGDAEPRRELDLADRQVDVPLAFRRITVNEILMRGQTHQRQSDRVRVRLDPLQLGG